MKTINGVAVDSNFPMIKNEEEYLAALAEAENLLEAEEGSGEMARFDVLADQILAYEDMHYPIPTPEPIGAIKFRMEQANLKQKDLIPCIGSKKMVSEVLAGKRLVTPEMAHCLNERFGIPPESLSYTSLKAGR
jgi:HTH-type transcriptional regulator/antitoxin HigA